MHEEKHTSITKDLERKIRDGEFGEKLPSVRALCETYSVALQTMTKALRPLRDNGLLVPGPGGTRILPHGRGAAGLGVVTVFALGPAELEPAKDPLLVSLREAAERDGVTLVLMWTSDTKIFKRKNFWKSSSTDGYIFLYSSFYPLLQEHLKESDIPFVVANWLPDDFKVHWVDWDNRKQYFNITRQLIEHGFRRIGYAPTLRYKRGVDYHFDLWRDICDFYRIENLSDSHDFFEGTPPETLQRWLARGREHFPEVILSFNTDNAPIVEFLRREKLKCQLLSTAVPEKERDPKCIYLPDYDYRELGAKVWKVFRDVYDKRAGAPHPHLVYQPLPIENLPAKKIPKSKNNRFQDKNSCSQTTREEKSIRK